MFRRFAPAAPADATATAALTGPARKIRVDVLGMFDVLQHVATAAAITNQAERTPKLAEALKEARRFFDESTTDVLAQWQKIEQALESQPSLNDWAGDQVETIKNDWNYATAHWPAANATSDSALAGVAKVTPRLERIARAIAFITVPSRINQRLANKRTGEKLVFADEFGDEIPNKDDQVAILNELRRQARFVPGLIMPDEGVIYKASAHQRGRVASVGIIVAVALLPFALLLFGDRLDDLASDLHDGLTLDDILEAYAIALVGAVAHFLLAYQRNVKRGLEPILGEWWLWINVKQGSILVSVGTLIAVVVLASWTLGELDSATALFLGYSADSMFDLLFDRFTAKAGAAQKALTDRLAPAPG